MNATLHGRHAEIDGLGRQNCVLLHSLRALDQQVAEARFRGRPRRSVLGDLAWSFLPI